MDTVTAWREALGTLTSQLGERLAQWLPNLFAAIVLLIVGWLAARFAKVLTLRLVTLLDGAIQRLFQRRGATAPPSALASGRVVGELVFWVVMLFFLTAAMHILGALASGRVVGELVFWVVMLFFLTAAMHILGVETFTAWMHRVLGYLPTLVVGALIILAGFLVSSLARDIVIAAAPLETASRRLLGRGAQAIILVTAIVIGADQIGINITFVVIITSVILAALLGGVALALSLGARTYVANLIGARYLRETYRVGQRVRIGEQEGRVLEFSATAIVLETTAGRMNIPGKVFNELPSVLLVGNSADEHR